MTDIISVCLFIKKRGTYMKQNRTRRNTFGATVVGGLALVLSAGCTTDSSTPSGSTAALGLSGTLSVSSGGTAKPGVIMEESVVNALVDLSTYKVVCTASTTPPTTATATVGADGKFSVSIPGATGQPLSCYMTNASGKKIADFLIKDTTTKNMAGKTGSYQNSAAFKQDANLGSVTYDPNSGEVTIPKTSIASSLDSSAKATVFDPTGVWTMTKVDFTVPDGVQAPCATGTNNCNGPQEGQTLYLKMWTGKQTSDNSAVYGLQLWQSQAVANQCGSGSAPYVGLSSAQKTSIGVDFSANGSSDAEFSYPSSVTFTDQVLSASSTATLTARAGITEPKWQMSTAKTRYSMQLGCSIKDITISGVIYHAYMCGPDGSGYYMYNLTGGCTEDATGDPIMVDNWSGISSCSNTTDGTTGVRSNQCTGTYSSKAVTCKNSWLLSANADGSSPDTNNAHNFNFGSLTSIAQNTLCSDGSITDPLKKLQCYADYYWASGLANTNAACVPRISTDWTATTAADFIKVDYKPNGLIFFEQYMPFADGSGGTLMSRDDHYDGVQVGSNNWVSCHVIETGALTLKKVSASKVLASYQSSTITTNTNKPACQAKFNGSRTTYLFYMTK